MFFKITIALTGKDGSIIKYQFALYWLVVVDAHVGCHASVLKKWKVSLLYLQVLFKIKRKN